MKRELKTYTLHNYRELPQAGALSDEMIREIEIVGHVLPFKTNNYVVEELIDWDNVETDPVFTLNFPTRGRLSTRNSDAVEQLMESGVTTEKIDALVANIRL